MQMKIKQILKYFFIGLIALLLISVLGLWIWSQTGTYPARNVAREALQNSKMVAVSQEDWIAFTPMSDPEVGLIFYPGGLVEPTAYAPVLREIAEEGILVVITPMPLNLGIFNTGAANPVLEAYPLISTWILAGHSLGGASAGIFAEANPAALDALVLWDSFPPDSADLSESSLSVLSIYGTTKGFPNTDNFDSKRDLLPDTTQFTAIEGASHAQFGDYGPQKGDVVPSLTLSEQHQIVLEIMLEFIHARTQ
jgi:hypothetical protein